VGWGEGDELPKPWLWSIPFASLQKEGVSEGSVLCTYLPEQDSLVLRPLCLARRERGGREQVTVLEKQVCQNFKGI